MAKMYTVDGKLLAGAPEVRIGESVYPVDNRTSTVKKVSKIGKDPDAVLKLAFGEANFKKIDAMDLPFPAYLDLVKKTMAAMTGEEAEEAGARFQEKAGENGGMVRPGA